MTKKVQKTKRKTKPKLTQRFNRQLFGFILLLFVFAILCYIVFIMFTEGTLFKDNYRPFTPSKVNNNTGLTSVSIVYKNVSNN